MSKRWVVSWQFSILRTFRLPSRVAVGPKRPLRCPRYLIKRQSCLRLR